MTDTSPNRSPRLAGRLWRGHLIGGPKKQPIFVPCPVAPPLRIYDDVGNDSSDSDVQKSPSFGRSDRVLDYMLLMAPITPPSHLSEIIKSSEEEYDSEQDLPPPPPQPDIPVPVLPAPSPPPLQKGPQISVTPPSSPTTKHDVKTPSTPPSPRTPTTPTKSANTKRWQFFTSKSNKKSLSKEANSKTKDVNTAATLPVSVMTPLPTGVQRLASVDSIPTPPPAPPIKGMKQTTLDSTLVPNAPPPPPIKARGPVMKDKITSTVSSRLPLATPDTQQQTSIDTPTTPTEGEAITIETKGDIHSRPPMAIPAMQNQTSIDRSDIPTPPPPPPLKATKDGPTSDENKKPDSTAVSKLRSSGPPTRTPSIEVPSEFPPPPPGVGGANEPVSPSYIIPRKPPRPSNTGFLAKIAKFNEVEQKEAKGMNVGDVGSRVKEDKQKEAKGMNVGDVGSRVKEDVRISVALNDSLEDLLSQLNKALPEIDEHPRCTPPETRTPTNSLESSQEFLDCHVSMFHHRSPGRDVTTITEEDMATKFDDTEKETELNSAETFTFNDVAGQFDAVNDDFSMDHVLTDLDGIDGKPNDTKTPVLSLDDDLAAFLDLDEFNICLDQIDQAIGDGKTNQASPTNIQQPGHAETASEGKNTSASASSVRPMISHTDSDSGDSDDSTDYQYPIGNKATFTAPLPSASFCEESNDEPDYVNSEFLQACLGKGAPRISEMGAERSGTPTLPPFPDDSSTGMSTPPMNYPTPPLGSGDEAEMRSLDDDDDDQTYDIPLAIRASQAYNRQVSLQEETYDVPKSVQEETYDVPKSVETEETYDVPKPMEGEDKTNQEVETLDVPKTTKGKDGKVKKASGSKSASPNAGKKQKTSLWSKSKSFDRPPPPKDVPPKPLVKKTEKKKKLFGKLGKGSPLPPKDPDLVAAQQKPGGEVEEEMYCSVEDVLDKGQEVVGDGDHEDWNSDDDKIYEDFEDWD